MIHLCRHAEVVPKAAMDRDVTSITICPIYYDIYLTRMLPINHNAMCPRSEAACTPTLQQTAYDGIPHGFLSIGLVPMKQSRRKKTGLEP